MPTPSFPTMEYQYAPLFSLSTAYKKGHVVQNDEGVVFKILKDLPANTLTEANIDEYAATYTPKPLPNPSRPFKEGIKSNSIIYTADSGHEQRRERSTPRKTFDLTWAVLTKDQYITIQQFFMAVLTSTPFNWTHPIEEQSYLVRFTSELFSGENFAHGPKGPLYKLQVSLLQVWS